MWQTGHLSGQSDTTPGHIGHQYSVSRETAGSAVDAGRVSRSQWARSHGQ